MQLSCNIHASSFVKGEGVPEWADDDDVAELEALKSPLALTGLFTFVYSYPLSTEARFPHKITPEMTGEDLLLLAREDYERIYKEEEGDAGDPGHIPGMLNRAPSAGRYGIWGHDFSDLYFEGVDIDLKNFTMKFSMGS